MKSLHLILLVALVMALFTAATVEAGKGPCLGCTVIISVLGQIAHNHEMTSEQAVNYWCKALSGPKGGILDGICQLAGKAIIPILDQALANNLSPDVACKATKMCSEDDQKCTMWKDWKGAVLDKSTYTPALSSPQLVDMNTLEYRIYNTTEGEVLRFFLEWFMIETRLVKETTPFFDEIFADNADTLLTRYYNELVAQGDKLAEHPRFARIGMIPTHITTADMLSSEGDDDDEKLPWYLNPWNDADHDGHSDSEHRTLRGSSWRGADCDDNNPDVYPGRVETTADDVNCNGIGGTLGSVPFEIRMCNTVDTFGVVGIGDSATAHFSIPPTWLDPKAIQQGTYDNFFDVLSNEADHPACSTTTGYDPKACPSAGAFAPFTSLYLKVRERNICSHRDYYNIGVNGASTKNIYKYVQAFKRNQLQDKPVLAFMNLIGNDVCSKSSSVDDMTTVEDFKAGIVKTLNYLDTQMPRGSHVFVGGLVDGRILWSATSKHIHPIGVPYPDFYDYLNCHHTSPCSGWMNADEKIREATTAHAKKLSDTYKDIIKEHSFINFDVQYIPLMELFQEIVDKHIKDGGNPIHLIEATDGFHPSSAAQSLLAQSIWDYITQVLKVYIPTNPNNYLLSNVFGDSLNGY